MMNSFSSWKSVNEQLFQKGGKQVLESPSGKKQKVVYRIQDDNKFILKVVRFDDLIASNKLTQPGFDQVVKFFNSQVALINAFGKLDDAFFKEKLLVYVIKKDTEKVEKIQFSILNRSEIPEIPAGVKYISGEELSAIKSAADVKTIVNNLQNKAAAEKIEEVPTEVIDASREEAKGTKGTIEESGSKFRYTMRTNQKTYLMEFTENGAIDANVVVGTDRHPNGAVSWEENSKVMWYTDEDNKVTAQTQSSWAKNDSNPLYTDGEITNAIDKEFLSKMFTDSEFRKKILEEYEQKYGSSEIDADSIKDMLYHRDGTKMFGSEEAAPSEAAPQQAAPGAAGSEAPKPEPYKVYYA